MSATTRLDRYQYVSALGSGGMATVVLAEDTVLGRQVALKRMKVADDARGLSRLRREALIGASVSHPNLVSIYDVVTADDGDQVIVMEYVPGETLRDAVFRDGGLPVASAMHILRGVAAALDAIHQQGIVHRDVKPANILLGPHETVKLADLGIAAAADRTRITSAGALVGTYSYMAPEQLEGAAATPAVDIYALSAVAFEALSGRKAHAEANPVALAHAIATQPPPDLRDAWPDAPEAAAEVLIRGMSKDPTRRPRSASELTGRLHAALEPATTAPHALPPGASRRGSRRRGAAAAGALALGGAAGAAAADAPAAKAEPARSLPRPAGGGGRTAAPPRRTDHARAASASERAGRRPGQRVAAAPAAGGKRSRAGLLAGLVVALVGLAVLLAVLLSGGGTPKPRSQNAARSASPRRPAPARRSSTSAASPPAAGSAGSSSSASSSPPARAAVPATPSAGAGSAADPVAAVKSFYGLAAAHQYSQAWALADPAFQNQLGGFRSFEGQQSGDRSITFNSAGVQSQSGNSATVAVQTTSVRNDGTHHCSGTVDVVRSGAAAAWMLHQISINCT